MYAYISTPGFWARKLFLSLSLSRVSRRRARFVVDRAPRADSRIARVSSRAMSRRRVGEKTLELTVDMFRNTSRASTSASAYARAKTLVDDGIIAKPSWYDAASGVRPSPRPMKAPKPPPITFPEDALIRGFYAREPAAAFEAIDCLEDGVSGGKTRSHYVRNFALRQLEIMRERKMNEREALKETEAERDAERERFEAAAREGEPLDESARVLTAPGEGLHGEFGSEIERIQAAEEVRWLEHVESARRAAGRDAREPRAPREPRRRR